MAKFIRVNCALGGEPFPCLINLNHVESIVPGKNDESHFHMMNGAYHHVVSPIGFDALNNIITPSDDYYLSSCVKG